MIYQVIHGLDNSLEFWYHIAIIKSGFVLSYKKSWTCFLEQGQCASLWLRFFLSSYSIRLSLSWLQTFHGFECNSCFECNIVEIPWTSQACYNTSKLQAIISTYNGIPLDNHTVSNGLQSYLYGSKLVWRGFWIKQLCQFAELRNAL